MLLAGVAWNAPAFAQTTLPPLSVQAKKAKAKSAKRAAPRAPQSPAQAAPAAPASEPPPVVAQDIPFTIPGSASTATRSDLDTFGQIGTDNILRSMPGVFTRDSASNDGVAVNIRGFEGAGRVNMMIDGVRQNFRFTGHEAGGFAYIDPSLLAGVDVTSGAVSTRGGAGALAGMANFRTLDVGDIIKPGQSTGILTTTTWGSNGVGWSGMAAAGARTDSVGIAGAISTRDQGAYKNGDGVTVPNTDRELLSGLFKLEIKPSAEHFLKFGGVFYDGDFTANSYFQNLQSNTFSMNYAYRPTDNPWVDFRFNAYKNDVVTRYLSAGSAQGRVIDVQGHGLDLSNTSRFMVGGIKFVSEYGFEYFGDDFDVINSTAAPGYGVNTSGKSSVASLFQQTKASYGIADLTLGLRYDMFKLSGSGSVAAGNPVGLPAGPYNVSREDERLNPKVTFALNPTPWFQPYVTYSESMRYPTVNESFTGGAHPDTGGPPQSYFPNPFLEPEIAKGWEFGFNIVKNGLFTRNDRFRFKAAYYTLDVENYITAFFTPSFMIYYDNHAGTSDVQGVELQGTYDAGFFFAGLSYTYTDSSLPPQINGFGAAAYLPDHVGTVSAGFRFLDQKLTVGARATFVSEAEVGAINGGVPTPSYELLDLFTSYKFDNGLQLGATMTNVFDETYTPALSTSASGGFGIPTGRGRTILFTAKAQF